MGERTQRKAEVVKLKIKIKGLMADGRTELFRKDRYRERKTSGHEPEYLDKLTEADDKD